MGLEAAYRHFEHHEPFAYVLWQRDHNSESVFRPLQKFTYDSFYAGVGSTGELAKSLSYRLECVYESGHSFFERRFQQSNRVDAWALAAELEYLDPGPHKARASVAYLFGSGDADTLAKTFRFVTQPPQRIAGIVCVGFVGKMLRCTPLQFLELLPHGADAGVICNADVAVDRSQQMGHPHRQRFQLAPAVAEVPMRDDQQGLTRADQVDQRHLHRQRSTAGHDERLGALGEHDSLQVEQAGPVGVDEAGGQMGDGGSSQHFEYALVYRRGAGDHGQDRIAHDRELRLPRCGRLARRTRLSQHIGTRTERP